MRKQIKRIQLLRSYVNAKRNWINLIASYRQIWVQEHCLAIPAMVIFAGSVLLFKGRWLDKAVFLVQGLIGIILINIIRLIFVSLAWVYLSAYYFKMHHSVIYVVAMYGFIFYMIVRWMNRMMKQQNPDTSIK